MVHSSSQSKIQLAFYLVTGIYLHVRKFLEDEHLRDTKCTIHDPEVMSSNLVRSILIRVSFCLSQIELNMPQLID